MWELIKTSADNHDWTPGKRGAGYIHARTNTPDSFSLLNYSIRTWNIGPDKTDDIDKELIRHRPIDVVVFKFHITPSGGVIPSPSGFQNRTSKPDVAVISFLRRKDNRLHDGRDDVRFNSAKKNAKDTLKQFLSSVFPRHSHSLTWVKGGRGRGLMLNDGTLITWPVDKKGEPQHAGMYEYLTNTKLPESHSIQDFVEGIPFDIYEDGTLAFFSKDVSTELMTDLSKIDYRLKVSAADPQGLAQQLRQLETEDQAPRKEYEKLMEEMGGNQNWQTAKAKWDKMHSAVSGYDPNDPFGDVPRRAKAQELIKNNIETIQQDPNALHNAWLLVQHMDPDPEFQKWFIKYLNPNEKTEHGGQNDYQYLLDRIQVGMGVPQTYGTQTGSPGVEGDEWNSMSAFYTSNTKKEFTKEDAFDLLDKNNWDFNASEFWMGMNDELEHEDVTHGDPDMTAKIVADHLREHPDYYTQLRTKISHSYQGFDFHFNTRTGEPCTCGYAPVGGKKLARRTASQAVRKIKNQDQKHLRSDEGQEILDFLHRMISGHGIEDKGEFGQGRLPGIEGLVPWIVKMIKDQYIVPVHKSDLDKVNPHFFRDPSNGRAPDEIEGDPIVDMAYFWGDSPDETPWDRKIKIAEWNKAKNVFTYDFEERENSWFKSEFPDKLVSDINDNVGVVVAKITTNENLNEFINLMSDHKELPIYAILRFENDNNLRTEEVGQKLTSEGLNVRTVEYGPVYGSVDNIKSYLLDSVELSNQEVAETKIPIDRSVYHSIPWSTWQKWFNATGAPAREGKNVMEMTPYQVKSAAIEHEAYLADLERIERWKEYFGEIKADTKVYDIKDPEFEGWTVNKIADAQVAEAVGDLLGHCIGSDEQPYKDSIDRGETEAYMLCDPDGLPHASWHYDPYNEQLAHVEGKSGNLEGTETEEKYRKLVTEFNNATDHDDYEGGQGSGWTPDHSYDSYVELPNPTTVSDLQWQLEDLYDAAYHYEGQYDWTLGENTEIQMGDPDWPEICYDFVKNITDEDAINFIQVLLNHSWFGHFVTEMKNNGYLGPDEVQEQREDAEQYGYAAPVVILVDFLNKHNVNLEEIRSPSSMPESIERNYGFTADEYEKMKEKEPHYDWPEWEDLTDVMGLEHPARKRREQAEEFNREYQPYAWQRQYLLPHVDPRLLDHEIQHNPDAPIPPMDVGSMAFRNVAAVHEKGYNGDVAFLHFNRHTGEECYCGYGPTKVKKDLTRTASDAVRKVKNQKQKLFQSDEGMAALNALNMLISGVPLGENDQGKVGNFPGLEKMVPWFVKQIKDGIMSYDSSFQEGFGYLAGSEDEIKDLKTSLAKKQSLKIGYFAPGALASNAYAARDSIPYASRSLEEAMQGLYDIDGFDITPIELTKEENPKWVPVARTAEGYNYTGYAPVEDAEQKDLDSFDVILFSPAVFNEPRDWRNDSNESPSLPSIVEQTTQLRELLGPDAQIILDANTLPKEAMDPSVVQYDAEALENFLPFSERPTKEEAVAVAAKGSGLSEEEILAGRNEHGRSPIIKAALEGLIFSRVQPYMQQLEELATMRESSIRRAPASRSIKSLLSTEAAESGNHPLKLSEVRVPNGKYTPYTQGSLRLMSNWINANNAPARKKVTANGLKGAVNRSIKKLAYLQRLHEDTGRGMAVDTDPTWDNEKFISLVAEELKLSDYNDPRKFVFYTAMKDATQALAGHDFDNDREKNNAILEKAAELALPQYEINVMDMNPVAITAYADAHQRYVEHMEELRKIKEYYQEEEEPDVVHRFQDPAYEGWTVVELDDGDDEQLTRESQVLKHCIGESDSPNYREAIISGNIRAFSLRDPDNIPKVTWHFNPDGSFAHIQGRTGASSEAVADFRPLVSEFNSIKGFDDDNGGVGTEQPLDEYGEPEDTYETLDELELWEATSMNDVIEQYDDPWSAASNQVAEMEGADNQEYRLSDDAAIHRGGYDWYEIASDFFEGGSNKNYMRQRVFEIAHEDSVVDELVEALDAHIANHGPEAWAKKLEGRGLPESEKPGEDQKQMEMIAECSECKGTGIGPNDDFGAETECGWCNGSGELRIEKEFGSDPRPWGYIADENNETYQMYKAFRALHTNPSSGAFEEPDHITREQYDKMREQSKDNSFVDYMPEWEKLYRSFGPDFENRPLLQVGESYDRGYLPTSQDPRSYQESPVTEFVGSTCKHCKGTGVINSEEYGEMECSSCGGTGRRDDYVETVTFGAGRPCAACNETGKVISPKSGQEIECQNCKGTGIDHSGSQKVYEHDDSAWGADVEGLGQIPGQTYMAKLTTEERAAAWDTPFNKLSAAQKAHVSGLKVLDPDSVWTEIS